MSEMPLEDPWYDCLWPVDPGCLTEDWAALSEDERERAVALASSALVGLTAGRVNTCPITVRPCAPRCCIPGFAAYSGAGWMNPSISSPGVWINGCGCSGNCSCSTACEITLPGPVGRVDQVLIDGTPVDLSNFRLDNGNILVWQGGGNCPFNVAQDLSLPDSEPGTFSITYLNAYPPGRQGAIAAAYLAMEFAKACKPKGKCALPRGVTDVVRNGVSFTIEAGLFPNGLTGIDVVDAFIERWNPNHRRQQTKIWSPGQSKMRRTRTSLVPPVPPLPPGGIIDGGNA